jgi:hypothetical protein
MSERTASSQPVLEGLRKYRKDLLDRIEFLSSGGAQVRVRHDQGWLDATDQVVANLYRQLGELGSLIHRLAAPAAEDA